MFLQQLAFALVLSDRAHQSPFYNAMNSDWIATPS